MFDPCLLHRWNGVDWGRGPACRAVTWQCPGCRSEQQGIVPPGEALPIKGFEGCDQCGCEGNISVIGWHPAAQLARAFRLSDARRPTRSKPEPQSPDPADTPRRTLVGWATEWPGLAQVGPSDVDGAFLEVFCQPPQRHRSRRLYSESELAKVVAHLGHEGSRAAHPEVQR